MKAEEVDCEDSSNQTLLRAVRHMKRAAAISLLSFPLWMVTSFAEEIRPQSSTEDKSTWKLIREKIRMRTFTEFMTPSFSGNQYNVPAVDGTPLMESNAFNIAWVDYEVAPNYRILYWQRFFLFYAPNPNVQGPRALARNPRFALRRTQVFNVPQLTTTYDLYIQPGLAPEGETQGRTFETGFRTATAYAIPKSKWNIGAVTEYTFAFSNQANPKTPGSYGWVMPWASYDLNSTFSTQHFFTFNFQHNKEGRWNHFVIDYPEPYTQNGISMNVSKTIWASVFLNNYLFTTPTLNKTWASLWLSLDIL